MEVVREKVSSVYNLADSVWTNHRWEFLVVCSILAIIVCWYIKEDSEYHGIEFDSSLLLDEKKKTTRREGGKKHETECRRIVEQRFGVFFPSVRPDWLKNPRTGRNLELDMYNSKLKLAFEYNGQQHRKYTPYFHKTIDDFDQQVYRDKHKARRCRDLGITLITIDDRIRYCDLKSHIYHRISDLGY